VPSAVVHGEQTSQNTAGFLIKRGSTDPTDGLRSNLSNSQAAISLSEFLNPVLSVTLSVDTDP
jgi:hypothetical protein